MYEHRRQRLLPFSAFVGRLVRHFGVSAAIAVASLFAGILGYRYFERLGWLDAFLNAAMLPGGMGPVDVPKTSGGKLFAGIYALYAGMVLLVVVGILLTPVVHRILHKFHIAEDTMPADEEAGRPRR